MPSSAAAVAVATPCWPAPVSATSRVLPMRRASSACPRTLLILCEPVWFRSSRLSSTRTPSSRSRGSCTRSAATAGRRSRGAGRRARRGRQGRPTPRGTRARAPRTAGTSVSGTNRPPNSPNRPSRVRLAHQRSSTGPPLTRLPASRKGSSSATPVGPRAPTSAAASMNALTLRGSLRPGLASTPVDTSTPHGRTASIALGDVVGREPAGEDAPACRAARLRPAPSRTPRPSPDAGESTRIASAP